MLLVVIVWLILLGFWLLLVVIGWVHSWLIYRFHTVLLIQKLRSINSPNKKTKYKTKQKEKNHNLT